MSVADRVATGDRAWGVFVGAAGLIAAVAGGAHLYTIVRPQYEAAMDGGLVPFRPLDWTLFYGYHLAIALSAILVGGLFLALAYAAITTPDEALVDSDAGGDA